MTSFSTSKLLYRASDNTFDSLTYYSMLSGKAKVLTIFKVKNNVFGSYINIANPYPNNPYTWQYDSAAFLFSLRRNGTSNAVKLLIIEIENRYAFLSHYNDFGVYGRAHDLYVANPPSTNSHSYANLGLSYSPPSGCVYESTCAQNFFVGAYAGWYVDEIEAFQLS